MAKHHSWQLATVRRVGTHKALARSLLSGSPDQCTRLGLELHRLSCSWKNVVLDVPTFANKRRNLGSTSSVTFESSIASMSTSASTTAKIAGISIKNKGTPSRKTKRKLGRKPNFNPILLEEPWGSLVAHAKRICRTLLHSQPGIFRNPVALDARTISSIKSTIDRDFPLALVDRSSWIKKLVVEAIDTKEDLHDKIIEWKETFLKMEKTGKAPIAWRMNLNVIESLAHLVEGAWFEKGRASESIIIFHWIDIFRHLLHCIGIFIRSGECVLSASKEVKKILQDEFKGFGTYGRKRISHSTPKLMPTTSLRSRIPVTL
ncbi:hypothetical protein B0O80DRAFT_533627 [Mortierella sp. GBAus27b]|nr:hypothetical protein B0O80DRAFT_533627 [Mortierella sp. GBAus27b]